MAAVSEAAKANRKAQKRAYYLKNRERENARVAAWVDNNQERSAEIKRAWRARNPEHDREYYLANKEHFGVYRDAYRSRARRATPPWVDREDIYQIYKEAKIRGLSVDHIVPLKGRNVSGLHVPWNLQMLPLAENIRKGNRHAS